MNKPTSTIPYLRVGNKLYNGFGRELNKHPAFQILETMNQGYLVTANLANVDNLVSMSMLTYVPQRSVTDDRQEWERGRK